MRRSALSCVFTLQIWAGRKNSILQGFLFPRTMYRGTAFVFLFVALVANCSAEFGPCRFDSNACSCKLGKENQGVCWDRIPGDPSNCRPRACKKGWTCACGGRTHLCKIGQMTSYHNTGAQVKMSDVTSSSAGNHDLSNTMRQVSTIKRPCSTKAAPTASNRELILGTVKFGVSPKGMLADKCTYLAWWVRQLVFPTYQLDTASSAR